jgi:tetratricopeptide (TPR) repeat protein
MRSERRHELEENELAESTGALMERVRPHLRTLAFAALAAVGAAAAWSLISAQKIAARERSWDECMAAMAQGDVDRLAEVIRRHPDTSAARWSQMLLAESAIAEGSQQLFGDPARGRTRLEQAEQIYTEILAGRPSGLVAERAVFGLAKARESLGRIDEARRGYEALVQEYPRSAVREMAEQRIAALGRGSSREWYDWFSTQVAEGGRADSAVPAHAPPATDESSLDRPSDVDDAPAG